MRSDHIHSWEDARRLAQQRLPAMMFDYIDGAAGNGFAEQRGRDALQEITLHPRTFRNVETRSIAKSIFGQNAQVPFGIAPMGMCNLSWPGADLMLARLAAKHSIPHCVSTAASTSLEDIVTKAEGNAWFQLYVGGDFSISEGLCDRAASSGYEVLMLTADVPQVARRPRELRHGFKMPFTIGPSQFLDFAMHSEWSVKSLIAGAPKPANFEGGKFDRGKGRGELDWDLLKRVRDRWKGKLVVKGILSVEDALEIKQHGADAIQVSSHGGRQLNSSPPPIRQLEKIRQAVGPEYTLLFDSGIRNGDDVVKAYAKGADFVMMGRPWLYAIAAAGEKGLNTFCDVLAEETSTVLAQIGLDDINKVDGTVILE